jgi:hypothetical protein
VPDLPPCRASAPPADEVVDRYLAVSCVVLAATRGVDGRALVAGFDVAHALRPDEAEYLDDVADGVRVEDAARALAIEQLAVLAWALGAAPEPPLDATTDLEPGVVGVEVGAVTIPDSTLRDAHDLYSAMAWALRADPDLAVGAAPGAVDPYVVRERLAALDWLLSR